MKSRRQFLRGFALGASGLFVPTLLRGAPGPALPFYASKAAVSNGLLAATVGYWTMNEAQHVSRLDSTGNGWTATDVNSSVLSSAGLLNNAAGPTTFNGGQMLQVSKSIDTRASSAAFSGQLWFKDAGAANQFQVIVCESNLSGDGWYVGLISGGTNIGFVAFDGGGVERTVDSGVARNTGSWFHILFGYDGTNNFIQVNNGTRVTLATSGVQRNLKNITFSAYTNQTFGWPGTYDECAYFNTGITLTQNTLLWNGGTPLPFSSYT